MERSLDIHHNDKHPCHVRNRVRELRNASHESQSALAEALHVSRQTVNSIENGRYLPLRPRAFALARHFGLPIERLFSPEEEP